MPRPIHRWLRLYVETPRDPKLRRLSPERRWIWIGILCAAKESHEPGALFVAPGLPMSTKELADISGVREREVVATLPLMQAMSMIDIDESGLIRVVNWSNRQFESDNVTKRTRDHRERSRERSNNVPGNGPDTETETETEKTPASAAADDEFDRFWEAYPKRVAKGAARKAWKGARKKVDANTIIAGASAFAASVGNTDPKFISHPASWLNGERWADESNVRPLRPPTDEQGRTILPPLPPKSPWEGA